MLPNAGSRHPKKLDNENDDEDEFKSASQLVRILQLLNSCNS